MRQFQHTITKADVAAVTKALKSDTLTRGSFVEKFEDNLAKFNDRKFAVAFSSATAALHAIMAYLIKPGDEVIVPAITFAATANAVLYAGGKVKFADVNKNGIIRIALGSSGRGRIVVPVDYSGRIRFCLAGKITVQDSAHSIGVKNQLCDYQVFSFHPVKPMTTGEGGAVVTDDEKAAKWLRQFRSHGITREGCKPGFYKQEFLGYNYNMTDIQAALGSSQLKQLPKFIKRRQKLARLYDQQLGLKNYTDHSAWHFYPIQVPASKRDKLLNKLLAAGIPANVHYIPVYWHPYYQSLGYKKGLCPNAEKFYRQEISLPIFPAMTSKDVEFVVKTLNPKNVLK